AKGVSTQTMHLTDPLDSVEIGSVPRVMGVQGFRAVIGVLLPPAAALVAFLVHMYSPNRQTAIPTRLYPFVLQGLLAATLVLLAVHWVWGPLRRRVQYYGPLIAGAILWLCIWDLMTLKLALMPLPYFPGPDMVLQGIVDDRVLLLSSAYYSLKLLLS